MAQTTYRIKARGKTWTTTDTDTAQRFAHSPDAIVTPTTMHETDIPGINVNQLSVEQLQEQLRIAKAEGWTHLVRMYRDALQMKVEQ